MLAMVLAARRDIALCVDQALCGGDNDPETDEGKDVLDHVGYSESIAGGDAEPSADGVVVHAPGQRDKWCRCRTRLARSEEHTSELQSLMRISYAVFCLKKKNQNKAISQEFY